jgi:O-succinylbenzoic acid--CoA ligase
MTSQVTTTPPAADLETLRTSGSCLPHRELRISEDGEILVRGGTLFAGYVERDHLRQPFDAEGWYHTGDLGTLDERGNLIVSGRRDNLFISGGENIQPEEIEWHLGQLPGVEQVVVVPVPDAEFGNRPAAFIRSSNAGSEADYRAALEAVLPRFKVPCAFLPLDDGANGERLKIDRGALTARAAALTGRA